MQSVYSVKLADAIKLEGGGPHFASQTTWLVVATSFANAHDVVMAKYPQAKIRGIDQLNYSGVPIVMGN